MLAPRIRLLDAESDLGRFLSQEDLAAARQLTVPVLAFAREDSGSLEARLEEHGAFAALVLEGMVLVQVRIGDQLGLRLLGPGDVVTADSTRQPALIEDLEVRVVAGTRLALLGRELLLGSHRWPSLVQGLHMLTAQQCERLTAQLVICQLPRVDQRLLAIMWLLAESWGRVTPSGTTLPLKLTHDALGALVGARRPTVTLALRDLSERGAIARQETGWLLLETPAGASEAVEPLRSPGLLDDGQHGWRDAQPMGHPTLETAALLAELRSRMATLRDRHAADRGVFDERLATLAGVRERCRESRSQVTRDRLSRRRSQSS